MKEMIIKPDVPYTHTQMMRDIAKLRARYPTLAGRITQGFSVEGRPLPVLTVGRGRTKVFVLCGASCARAYHCCIFDV